MMSKVGLSHVLENIKMDKNVVDTTKAEKFISERRHYHSDSSINGSEYLTTDSFENKIFCLSLETFEELFLTCLPCTRDDYIITRAAGLQNLAEEIEKNTDLICQLEYLIRNIPVQETKHSIQLIVKHLRFSCETELVSVEEVVIIRKNTPLLALGCLIQGVKLYDFVHLFATNETALICYYFAELCKKVGLDCVKLVIGESKKLSTSTMDFPALFSDYASEVIGIITDKSDIDSAIDVFLNSGRHPFPLTRIFVQDSVYKYFKDIMSWKCKLQHEVNTSFKSNCTDAFTYENKTFYLDYAGNIEDAKSQCNEFVFVEAFRTSNELLSLINNVVKPLCLSIWSSDVSEANEIALNVKVPVVWINGYCNFNGPTAISQAIYDKTYSRRSIETERVVIDNLTKQQKTWSKQPMIERYKTVVKALQEANIVLGNIIKEKNQSYWRHNDFNSVEHNTMIMGLNVPIELVCFYWTFNLKHDIDHPKMVSIWLSIAKALINGSAIGYKVTSNNDLDIIDIFDKLATCGVPVAEMPDVDENDPIKHKITFSYYAESVQTKVVWTGFGTKFAN